MAFEGPVSKLRHIGHAVTRVPGPGLRHRHQGSITEQRGATAALALVAVVAVALHPRLVSAGATQEAHQTPARGQRLPPPAPQPPTAEDHAQHDRPDARGGRHTLAKSNAAQFRLARTSPPHEGITRLQGCAPGQRLIEMPICSRAASTMGQRPWLPSEEPGAFAELIEAQRCLVRAEWSNGAHTTLLHVQHDGSSNPGGCAPLGWYRIGRPVATCTKRLCSAPKFTSPRALSRQRAIPRRCACILSRASGDMGEAIRRPRPLQLEHFGRVSLKPHVARTAVRITGIALLCTGRTISFGSVVRNENGGSRPPPAPPWCRACPSRGARCPRRRTDCDRHRARTSAGSSAGCQCIHRTTSQAPSIEIPA